MTDDFSKDLEAVARIPAVATILEVVCRTTGMGFAAVARVTEDRWIACDVRDEIQFGLKPGGELKVETTICNEIRQSGNAVVIDHVSRDNVFCSHPTPAMYGFESYISVPIILPGRGFFGTLCAIDPRPARVNTPPVIGMFNLFAELIAFHLDAQERLAASAASLSDERRTAELREQFIAVLGHDLRNPLASIDGGAQLLGKMPLRRVGPFDPDRDAQQRRAHGDADRQRPRLCTRPDAAAPPRLPGLRRAHHVPHALHARDRRRGVRVRRRPLGSAARRPAMAGP